MKKDFISYIKGLIVTVGFTVLILSCVSNQISMDMIPVDWNNKIIALNTLDEAKSKIESNLRKNNFYSIRIKTLSNTSTSIYLEPNITYFEWGNTSSGEVDQVSVYITLNYFFVQIDFSSKKIKVSYHPNAPENSRRALARESPYFNSNDANIFINDFNEALDRILTSFRGRSFVDNEKYEIDRYWLDALRY